MTISIALYQPDIPGNTGTILRMAACFGLEVHIIEPTGFDLSDRSLKRAGMDYLEQAALTRHLNWDVFKAFTAAESRRVILMSTKAAQSYAEFEFRNSDILMFGRETTGVPAAIHEAADVRLIIPMQPERRSLNLAISVAVVTGEALRQTGRFGV
jgi:tRNA (cytidine/uridine-2'-O-)-methyltransferase